MSDSSSMPPLDPLPHQLLHYLTSHKVLICTACQYAIQPNAIARHLKDIHLVHRGRRKPFMAYVSTIDLASPEEVFSLQLKHDTFPVPGLPVLDGLRCSYEGCEHLCVSTKRMRSHWATVHTEVEEVGAWDGVRLQTFFKGNLLRYFTSGSKCRDPVSDIQKGTWCECRADWGHPTCQSHASPPSYRHFSDTYLLNHFIVNTSLTLSLDSSSLWQNTIPLLATSQPFLYHGLLCCSAFHLAHLHPAYRTPLILLATSHQTIAMPLFQTTMLAVTAQNCDAVLAFAHLLIINTFAAEAEDDKFLLITPPATPMPIASVGGKSNDETVGRETVVPPWLYLLRTGCSIMCEIWPYLEVGPLRNLATQWDIPDDLVDSRPTPLLAHLLSLVPSPEDFPSHAPWTEHEAFHYTHAATSLDLAFRNAARLGTHFTTWDALRVWPIWISEEFLQMLARRHPGALVLLAYYCVQLKMAEVHWYFDGRAKRLLRDILVSLDGVEGGERWKAKLDGVVREVGVTT